MAVNREVLLKELVDETCEGRRLTKLELQALFDKWTKLGTSNMRNIISEERSKARGHGEWESDFFKLKRHSMYDFIHDSVLPRQGREKIIYIFKMSTCRVASGVDLVRRMQPWGDLQFEWVMYDHVKRIDGWTTLGIHVYDLEYRKVMTIVVYDMRCEAQDAQMRMWQSLLEVMELHGYTNINFKGFMADSAQANFNAVRIVFGFEDPKVPMVNWERTFQFHWKMALERYTKQLIKPKLQSQHIKLC